MGLFFKDKPSEQKTGTGTPPTSAWAGQVKGTSTAKSYLGGTRRSQPVTTTVAATATTIDAEFASDLAAHLQTVPAPKGFDVFLATLESLSKYIPDEGNRYKAAMEAAATSGLSPMDIVATLQAQSELLRQIEASFLKDLDTEAEEQTAEREQQLKALTAQIEEIDRQLKKLQQEKQDLADDQRELQEANAQVVHQKAAVTTRFQSAFGAHMSKTQELLQKVRTHLGQ